MSKEKNFKVAMKRVMRSAEKHAPTILTCIGAVSLVGTVIFTAKATPKCQEILAERKKKIEEAKEIADEKLEQDETPEEVKKELKDDILKINIESGVKLAKASAGTAGCFVATLACMIGANTINLRRLSDISTAYELSNKAFQKYKAKTKEKLGDKKEREIKEEIIHDDISDGNGEVLETGKGGSLIYDALSGRLFKADKLFVEKMVCEVNNQLFNDMFVSLNEFYDLIGLNPIKLGEYMGFNVEDGMLRISWTTMSVPVNGVEEPCWVMDYDVSRRHRWGDE